MAAENHTQLASFIWSICNLLRGPYKRNEYRKVILPLTVLRRFDCILAPTKAAVLKEHAAIKAKPENIIRHKLSLHHQALLLQSFQIYPRQAGGRQRPQWSARRPEPARAESQQLHQRLLAQRPRHHGAV
jgi:type I restriction-modification system DNA methylase subunit